MLLHSQQADYVRWGNVKRVTNMRKEQQDALWEGVVARAYLNEQGLRSQLTPWPSRADDFDRYWAVAAKLIPSSSAPSPTHTRSSTPASAHSSSGQASDSREAGTIRSVPLRVYLPEGAPILQELVPPIQDSESGRQPSLRWSSDRTDPNECRFAHNAAYTLIKTRSAFLSFRGAAACRTHLARRPSTA